MLTALLLLGLAGAADAQQYTRSGQLSQDWTCSLDNIAATLTECKAAPGTGKQLYITTITAQSTTATAGQFLLRTGTGTNCGTGTASLFPSAATVIRFAAPGNGSPATNINFTTPLPAPINTAICMLGVATNTVTIQISGFLTGF
jgi:hypothetical protein